MDPNEPSSTSRRVSRLSHFGSRSTHGGCDTGSSRSFDRLMHLVARVSDPRRERSGPELPAVGSTVAKRYVLERLIACGGMGAVFEAHHAKNGRKYALKWILPKIAHEADVQGRFKREAEAGLRIRHPNVVRVFAVGEDRGSPFLVMELLHGRSLQRVIERGPLDLPRALATFLPVLRGVGAVHASGVVHRDLKPDNIMLVRDRDPLVDELEIPKLLDFGLCKPIGADDDLAGITRRDVVLGTPAFTAPEQLLGEAVDARADIYSLGVMLYSMLTGRRPFEATTYNRLLFKIATETPIALSRLQPNLPEGLDAVVLRAMARQRDDRFASVEALAQALTRLPPSARAQLSRAAS